MFGRPQSPFMVVYVAISIYVRSAKVLIMQQVMVCGHLHVCMKFVTRSGSRQDDTV